MSSPQVEYRQLGKSGLRVSVPILGAMSFGTDKWAPWVINEDQVRQICRLLGSLRDPF
jgi:aryl-alcohol dehydrogenase-like predicted oxidoreductase